MLLQYRAAAVAGFITQLFWGLIRMMIFEAFYRSSTMTQPMELRDVITYVWLGQALFALFPWAIDQEIRQMIRNGTVAYELLKPVDLYKLWFSRSVANRLAPTILRFFPLVILAMLFFGMHPPDSVYSGIAWLLATVGAVCVGCAINTLLNISIMWTISGDGVQRIAPAAILIFSGMIIPLPLFPDWAQAFLQFLPFAGLVDLPFRLYLGHIPSDRVFYVLLHQAAWTVTLVALGRALLNRGIKILVVQGG